MNLLKGTAAGLAMAAGLFASAQASDLSGTLKIFSDMSNPAPRAVMEKMASDFDALHPDLTVELTIIDREAYKTQNPQLPDRQRAGCCQLVRGEPYASLCERRPVRRHL